MKSTKPYIAPRPAGEVSAEMAQAYATQRIFAASTQSYKDSIAAGQTPDQARYNANAAAETERAAAAIRDQKRLARFMTDNGRITWDSVTA
jgi:hypothetical protein